MKYNPNYWVGEAIDESHGILADEWCSKILSYREEGCR